MLITIDGPGGAGKSTLAKLLAESFGIKYFNSGMVYRAIAYLLDKNGVTPEQWKKFNSVFKKYNLKVEFVNGDQRIFVDKQDITANCYENRISYLTSLYSKRAKFVEIAINQTKLTIGGGDFIIEGRGLGSCLFQDADIKIYLDCDAKIRAERRFKELKLLKQKVDFDTIYKEILQRDENDRTREYANLVIPNGAIYVDSSSLTVEQVADCIKLSIQKIKKMI